MPTVEGQSTTKRVYPLHDNMLGGVQTTLPAHLLGPDQWRTQHNWRLTPQLEQVLRKIEFDTIGSDDIRFLGTIPLGNGYGKTLVFTPTSVTNLSGDAFVTGLNDDSAFRRWAVAPYNSTFYYCNELNSVRRNSGTLDSAISGAPSGRYLCFWYDHLVVGYPTFKSVVSPNRVMISDLGNFDGDARWTPTKTNEADYYDFLEWQLTDYPFVGVTGIGKLRGLLWVYTPTALIPLSYVGLPKIIKVEDEGIITRVGNTFPWTLVCLDQVHFFYDGIEQMFWAFDGQQLTPIGDPVRKYLQTNLNPSPALASKMYGYIDVDNREIWWPFVSTKSTGDFDLAVVFNYRYKKWYTASVENVQCFCGGARRVLDVGELTGTVEDLVGDCGSLGLEAGSPRLFGSGEGKLLREEVEGDDTEELLGQDNPVLESADFHYGDIRATKENDVMVINAVWDVEQNPDGKIVVTVNGREFLGVEPEFEEGGEWTQELQDGILTYTTKAGRVFRYRFETSGTRRAVFSAFSESVYAKRAEK